MMYVQTIVTAVITIFSVLCMCSAPVRLSKFAVVHPQSKVAPNSKQMQKIERYHNSYQTYSKLTGYCYWKDNFDNFVAIDAVVVVSTKDIDTAIISLVSIRKMTKVRKIFVIGSRVSIKILQSVLITKQNDCRKEDLGIMLIDESSFPFDLATVIEELRVVPTSCSGSDCLKFELPSNFSRGGWYFQQLLKMYSGFRLPSIADNWVVIDSDTIFLKPVSFIGLSHEPLYFAFHHSFLPCENHIHALLPKLTLPVNYGPTHHMVFNKSVMHSLMTDVELYHQHTFNDSSMFWKLFLHATDIHDPVARLFSGASEYMLYLAYLHTFVPHDRWSWRSLMFRNVASELWQATGPQGAAVAVTGSARSGAEGAVEVYWEGMDVMRLEDKLDFVSLHAYMRHSVGQTDNNPRHDHNQHT